MKVRKLRTFGKDIGTVEDIFILKLQVSGNHRKLDVPENSKVVHRFQQNELYKGNVVSKSKLGVQFVKSTTRSNMLKCPCKTKDLTSVFRFQRVASGCTFYKFLTGISPI